MKAYYFLAIILILCVCSITSNEQSDLNNLRFLSDNTTDSELSFVGIKCFWLEPNTLSVFDLKNLQRPILQKYDYNFTKADDIVLFNFCNNIIPTCEELASQVTAFNKLDFQSNCVRLSGAQLSTNNWTLLNSTDATGGFKIELNSGETCKANPISNHTVSYIMKCDPEMKAGEYNLTQASISNFDRKNCVNQLEFITSEACPKVNFYAIWGFLLKYKVFFGAVLILIGLFEVLLGAKLMIVTIFLTTCSLTVTVVFIFLFQFIIPNGVNPNIIWVVLGISIVCGFIFGYLISKYNKFLIGVILGGYMGYFLGLILYNLALNHIKYNPTVIFWITILVSILVCALVAYFLVELILIISTSFIGAYALIRGISLYAGGYPDEIYIIDLIKNQEYATLRTVLTPVVYAYIAGWALLFVLGSVFQYKTKSEKDKMKNEPNDNKERKDNKDYFLK